MMTTRGKSVAYAAANHSRAFVLEFWDLEICLIFPTFKGVKQADQLGQVSFFLPLVLDQDLVDNQLGVAKYRQVSQQVSAPTLLSINRLTINALYSDSLFEAQKKKRST